jgi:hypothetical protein
MVAAGKTERPIAAVGLLALHDSRRENQQGAVDGYASRSGRREDGFQEDQL